MLNTIGGGTNTLDHDLPKEYEFQDNEKQHHIMHKKTTNRKNYYYCDIIQYLGCGGCPSMI